MPAEIVAMQDSGESDVRSQTRFCLRSWCLAQRCSLARADPPSRRARPCGSCRRSAGRRRERQAPSSYDRRPLDPAAFASEFSPNAGVSQEDRTRALVNFVEETNRQTGAPVVLVGHSLGGLTVTAVAEAIPERLHAVVCLCAFLIPPGMSASAISQHPSMRASLVPTLLKANPMEVGAITAQLVTAGLCSDPKIPRKPE